MSKKKRKGIKCPECSHGTLIDTSLGYHQCSLCLIYFFMDTLEPLNEITFLGATRVLGHHIQCFKETLNDNLSPFYRVFEDE